MTILNGSHAPEDVLESYALARLTESECAAIEEHLLLCGECRERLIEIEEFIDALRVVAPVGAPGWLQRLRVWLFEPAGSPEPAEAGTGRTLTLSWMSGAAAAVLAVFWLAPRTIEGPALVVELRAVRSAGGPGAEAVEGRALDLGLDLAGLPEETDPAAARVVDRYGVVLRSEMLSAAAMRTGHVRLRLNRGLPAGQYWVQVIGTEGAETRREFGLTVREPRTGP